MSCWVRFVIAVVPEGAYTSWVILERVDWCQVEIIAQSVFVMVSSGRVLRRRFRVFIGLFPDHLYQWTDIVEARSLSHRVVVSVPFDDVRIVELREVYVGHLEREMAFLLIAPSHVSGNSEIVVLQGVVLEESD
jgi:hypothetical protein